MLKGKWMTTIYITREGIAYYDYYYYTTVTITRAAIENINDSSNNDYLYYL